MYIYSYYSIQDIDSSPGSTVVIWIRLSVYHYALFHSLIANKLTRI